MRSGRPAARPPAPKQGAGQVRAQAAHAKRTPLSAIGSTVTRAPSAAMALASAGPAGGTPGSPTPVGGSADGTIWTSMAPMSDSHDLRPIDIFRVSLAGSDRYAVDMDRAGLACGHAATVFGARQLQLVPQHPQERRAVGRLGLDGMAVDLQCRPHPRLPSFELLPVARPSGHPSAPGRIDTMSANVDWTFGLNLSIVGICQNAGKPS